MWKRLVVLWAGMAAVIYFLFFYRIETHAVKLDMPPNSHVDPRQVEIAIRWFSVGVPAAILVALLALFIWLNFRIIRRYRKSG